MGEPKTHERRQVPLPAFLCEPLGRLMEAKARDALLFTTTTGSPLDRGNWSQRVLDAACREAGIDRITPHDLRHTAASLAVASGANVKGVQRMLGHSSAALTLDTYAGLFDGHLDEVAERMNEGAMRAMQRASAHHLPTDAGGHVLPMVASRSK